MRAKCGVCGKRREVKWNPIVRDRECASCAKAAPDDVVYQATAAKCPTNETLCPNEWCHGTGWAWAEDPGEVQACDFCRRFKSDEAARAHVAGCDYCRGMAATLGERQRCDLCGRAADELSQAAHLPGVLGADGVYRAPWVCGNGACLGEASK